MKKGISVIIFPVKDLAKAKSLYGKLLGEKPYADAPYYVGFRVGELEIGLDPNGHKQGLTAPLGYFQVEDIQDSLKSLVEAGSSIVSPARDVGKGLLVASVKDVDGNVIGLRQEPKVK